MSDSEKTLVEKARELAKFETKRATAVDLLATIDVSILRLKAEIAALVQPK